jgi:hypothetical protein
MGAAGVTGRCYGESLQINSQKFTAKSILIYWKSIFFPRNRCQPSLNVPQHLFWDFPGKEVGHLGVGFEGAVGQVSGGFLTAGGGDVAIARPTQHQGRQGELRNFRQTVITLP